MARDDPKERHQEDRFCRELLSKLEYLEVPSPDEVLSCLAERIEMLDRFESLDGLDELLGSVAAFAALAPLDAVVMAVAASGEEDAGSDSE